MRNLFIVDIEPLESRYTKQWQEWIPKKAEEALGDKFKVTQISGTPYPAPQAGAFFDFTSTCVYKAEQAINIANLFKEGKVQPNDVFFFTDAWNQTIHTLKYISELNEIPIKCVGILHAGWYDPTDILGVKIKNSSWVKHLEASMISAYDVTFFGTYHHRDKFCIVHYDDFPGKLVTAGYPLEWIKDLSNNLPKDNIVVFPHRLNEDKAPWVFDAIEEYVHDTLNRKDIEFIKTQELNLDKGAYYEFLKKCKVIFSANKHENLGIGTFEAMTAGCLPILPDKLSYKEMYPNTFKYQADEYFYNDTNRHLERLSSMIIEFIDNYNSYDNLRRLVASSIQARYFNGDKIFATIGSI